MAKGEDRRAITSNARKERQDGERQEEESCEGKNYESNVFDGENNEDANDN